MVDFYLFLTNSLLNKVKKLPKKKSTSINGYNSSQQLWQLITSRCTRKMGDFMQDVIQ